MFPKLGRKLTKRHYIQQKIFKNVLDEIPLDEIKTKGMSVMASQFLQSYGANLAVGTLGGIVLGHVTMKVARKAGCVTGVGIIGYEVAHHTGLVKTSLDSVLGKVQKGVNTCCSKYCSTTTGHVKGTLGRNRVLAVGLIGGTLLGLAM